MSTTDVFIHTDCCCRWCCCSVRHYTTAAAVVNDVAEAAAVRHRVHDGKKCCWFNESEQAAWLHEHIVGSIPSVLSVSFIWCAVLLYLIFVWRRVVSQPSTSRTRCPRYFSAAVRRIIYLACIYTECGCRCCRSLCCYNLVVAPAAAAVRHRVRDSKICCWFIESDSNIYIFS